MNKINYNIGERGFIDEFRKSLGITDDGLVSPDSIPYAGSDSTCGIENEFQTAVKGSPADVDLAIYIRESGYLRNLIRRAERGDLPWKRVREITGFLEENRTGIWENSWVRFPRNLLSLYAESVFRSDIRADKKNPDSPERGDVKSFVISRNGEEWLRIPVSYMLKLSLADAVSGSSFIHPVIRWSGESFLDCYLNDNTSPEIVSFFPVRGSADSSMADNIRDQNLKSYLLTQMLVMYANKKFELSALGQEVSLYFSPHPPVRQKRLNEMVTDSFYRELFMSPCLSGWDRGEDKHAYMNLCHQVLSRSSLNSVLKLKEAGIISGNRVFLKGISNISLANNGTHISIGSRKLNEIMKSGDRGYGPVNEKYFGDLAVKIYEHFVPLFSGTYTAAPYRLGYEDFHPEKVLGFLCHELDYTYVRMIWRRWLKKADIKIFGNPVIPFGSEGIEKFMARIFRLRGDYVNDFRLMDYLVALLSTDESPALNGVMGNDDKLKQDLVSMGIFDRNMSVYSLYRQRSLANNGYTGFEGRYYSLFESLGADMRHAASLQVLVTALAYRYILNGEVTHGSIPDSPETESERRQILFGSSIGIPTFYVRKNNSNALMMKILSLTSKSRNSGRYQGYLRVHNDEYKKALLKVLRGDGADLIESLGMEDTMRDLELRVSEPGLYSAAAKIKKGILEVAGEKKPLNMPADEFNQCAEKFYRENLRNRHMGEALEVFMKSVEEIERDYDSFPADVRSALGNVLNIRSASRFVELHGEELMTGTIPLLFLRSAIHLLLISLHIDKMKCSAIEKSGKEIFEIRVTG
ncbi:MAG TPA: hypothetical protein PK358_01525 [Spirochaetota bacterium]|nr:hypothetical protein [Spirochaetota bacterium]HPJ33482.1 hypothetical protein [Spirochaetota bacterium]